MQIRKAELKDLDGLMPQFNAYREFYEREPDESGAKSFITENIRSQRSTIFVAIDDNGTIVGFVQLYTRLSSLAMTEYVYLGDLYVDQAHRKSGVGRQLMKAAEDWSNSIGAFQIQLLTAHTNSTAQALYESLGYKWDQVYRSYALPLPGLVKSAKVLNPGPIAS